MTQLNVQSTAYTVTGNAGKECDPILNTIGSLSGMFLFAIVGGEKQIM